MRTPFRIMLALVAIALILAWAGNSARADQYWTNDLSGGNFTNTDSWMSGTVPVASDFAYFTNNAGPSSIYTVTFTTSQTNNGLRVVNDSVRFDMGGYYFWGTNTTQGNWITSSVPQRVVFSSSSSPLVSGGNVIDLGGSTTLGGAANTAQIDLLAGPVDIEISDELGYPVRFRLGSGTSRHITPASLTVSGTNSTFEVGAVNSGSVNTMLLVTNQAVFLHRYTHGVAVNSGTTRVVNATYIAHPGDGFSVSLSNTDRPRMYVTDNGTLVVGVNSTIKGLTVGGQGNLAGAELVLDNSTGIVSNMLWLSGQNVNNPGGRVYVQNGATLWVRSVISGTGGSLSNTLVLNNGTITLGGGATAGVITNRDIMRAAGTIRGLGNSPALLYTGPAGSGGSTVLEIGNSIGTLTLSNVNLEIAAGSETLWEISDTGVDQIVMVDGSASLLGSNLFSLASGSAPLTPGVKWGLGTYDFIVGTNITWNPQYNNITSFLASAGLAEGLDYRFGFVDLGGSQALRLEFVPEPSTVLLLVGGGLLLARFRPRRRRAPAG